jgi:hypothetical protein
MDYLNGEAFAASDAKTNFTIKLAFEILKISRHIG